MHLKNDDDDDDDVTTLNRKKTETSVRNRMYFENDPESENDPENAGIYLFHDPAMTTPHLCDDHADETTEGAALYAMKICGHISQTDTIYSTVIYDDKFLTTEK